MDTEPPILQPKCVATRTSIGEPPLSNQFREAQFSGDGTTIVTNHVDQHIRSFILPPELLDGSPEPHPLTAYSSFRSPSAVQSYATYPFFNLQDLSTTACLYAATDLPISLVNAIRGGVVHAKYPLVHPLTEEYIAPKCLTWNRDGSLFIAGSARQVSIFDASYDGNRPFVTHRCGTTSKTKKRYGPEMGYGPNGIVMALAISPDGMLAAGTAQREIGIFANEGSGECETSFSAADDAGPTDRTRGAGITNLAWSPCGTYLLAAERQSDGIHVYDMRNTLQKIAWLSGRKAHVNQRLSMEVVPTPNGYEVWAGGKDGCVRMWKDPGSLIGEQPPDQEIKMHDDAVSGIVWHPSGSVLATCSNEWQEPARSWHSDDESGNAIAKGAAKALDNTLKVWTV